METKTNKAVLLFRSGQIKEALAIFRTFKAGFTNDEKRTLQIASEALSGNDKFYKQIGIDTGKEIEKSKELLTNKYLNSIK